MSFLTTESEWARNGTLFSARSRADKEKILPGGVYSYKATMTGWYLDRIQDEFTFPFKVYSASSAIINRIITYWKTNGGNLGILMNGLRGAGKTMTAQLLANALIKSDNLPVVVVKDPVPLQDIYDAVKQDMMVIFDEFEKTHPEDQQQKLLSVVDGMNRSVHGRLCVFTTNSPSINENFKDRPSRIRYSFEFQRVADEIIEGLLDDGLPADLKHLKNEITDFLALREICTIDIVKAVISEVKTFKKSPTLFENILNITRSQPPSFSLSILSNDTLQVVNTVSYFFQPGNGGPLLSGNQHALDQFKKRDGFYVDSYSSNGLTRVRLLEKCKEPYVWLAEVAVPAIDTFWGKYSGAGLDDISGDTIWLNNRPQGWKLPTVEAVKADPAAREELDTRYTDCGYVLYGGKASIFKVKLEPNNHKVTPYSRYTPAKTFEGFSD